jgi:glycosyltransferase involved in cell wall biosynthesis
VRLAFACQGLSLSEFYGTGDELFERWFRLGSSPERGFRRALETFRPDVIHSHNLPDSLTVLALDVVGGRVPVVHDVHDLQSLRVTPYEDGFPEPEDPAALERRAIEGSDALLTVSRELLDRAAERHRLPALRDVFPNFALARDLPPSLPPRRPGLGASPRLVYQGSLSVNGGHYDLREILAGIVREGARLDVFPTRAAPAYLELAAAHPGLRVYPSRSPAALLAALPRYDLGWAGFNDALNGPHLDTVLPNKAFEYAACGLPVATLGHRALASWVRREGAGVVLDGVDGLVDRLRALDLDAIRRRLAARRRRFTIEANIRRVLELYARLGVAVPAAPRLGAARQ